MHKATDNATELKSIEINIQQSTSSCNYKILEIVGGAGFEWIRIIFIIFESAMQDSFF
jgi:hypothetical protein